MRREQSDLLFVIDQQMHERIVNYSPMWTRPVDERVQTHACEHSCSESEPHEERVLFTCCFLDDERYKIYHLSFALGMCFTKIRVKI